MEGHVTYELNIEVWLIVDVTCPSVTFMYRYGRTKDDSLTNKAFISIDSNTFLFFPLKRPKILRKFS